MKWYLIGYRSHAVYLKAASKAQLFAKMNCKYEKRNKERKDSVHVTLPEPMMPVCVREAVLLERSAD